uniref:Transcription factor CBF/NF-Y/archaeal histone domain-containing protein n=1 Tax=Nothoprocta perdicaria TaxID=30464 RepID=A0A8C6Z3M3_NOTPE
PPSKRPKSHQIHPKSSQREPQGTPQNARIKKIMQTDEEIGKVAAAVPVIISRALELFLAALLRRACHVTQARNAKTMTTAHLGHVLRRPRPQEEGQGSGGRGPGRGWGRGWAVGVSRGGHAPRKQDRAQGAVPGWGVRLDRG